MTRRRPTEDAGMRRVSVPLSHRNSVASAGFQSVNEKLVPSISRLEYDTKERHRLLSAAAARGAERLSPCGSDEGWDP
jgi:hypothetical protein